MRKIRTGLWLALTVDYFGGKTMRMLAKIKLPTEAGNRAIKDGSLPDIIRKTMESVHAEAAYFTVLDGHRTMLMVFDLKTPSDMPRIVEPLFMGLNAEVDLMPCMNADDLKTGLSGLK
jgi:hypothetical protein